MTDPLVGTPSPEISRSRVDLPQPLGPTMLVMPFGRTSKLTPLTASTPFGYANETSRTETRGATALCGGRGCGTGVSTAASEFSPLASRTIPDIVSEIVFHCVKFLSPPSRIPTGRGATPEPAAPCRPRAGCLQVLVRPHRPLPPRSVGPRD